MRKIFPARSSHSNINSCQLSQLPQTQPSSYAVAYKGEYACEVKSQSNGFHFTFYRAFRTLLIIRLRLVSDCVICKIRHSYIF